MDDFGTDRGTGKLPIVLPLVLFLLLAIAGGVGYARLSGRVGGADDEIGKLRGALQTAIDALQGVNSELGDYSKRNDALIQKMQDAVRTHDEQISTMGEIANRIADRLAGVDTGVNEVKTDVKGQGVQLSSLKKKFANLDTKFGEIEVALREESAKNKLQLSDILGRSRRPGRTCRI